MNDMLKIKKSIEEASKVIMPLSPLKIFAAINPWEKLEDHSFHQVAQKFKTNHNIDLYPNFNLITEAIKNGEIDKNILKAKIWSYYDSYQSKVCSEHAKSFTNNLLNNLGTTSDKRLSDDEINILINEIKKEGDLYYTKRKFHFGDSYYISNAPLSKLTDKETIKWSKVFLDKYQSSWSMPGRENEFFKSWKKLATYNSFFNKNQKILIDELPDSALDSINYIIGILQIDDSDYVEYFEHHLLALPGWSGMMLWHSKKNKEYPDLLIEYLAVRIVNEYILLQSKFVEKIEMQKENSIKTVRNWFEYNILGVEKWQELSTSTKKNYIEFSSFFNDIFARKVCLESWEETYIKNLKNEILSSKDNTVNKKVKCQLAFCIDVRSEPFRRQIDKYDSFETIGVAGFFGLPIQKHTVMHDYPHSSLPVMSEPKYQIRESINENNYFKKKNFTNSVLYTFKLMKSNTFPSLLLPELSGPFLGLFTFFKSMIPKKSNKIKQKVKEKFLKLPDTTLTIDRQKSNSELPIGFSDSEKIEYTYQSLKTMGLDKDFAPLIVLCGHGSESQNNPYDASLQCGACGGASSAFNAKTLATLCNLSIVRDGLNKKGINIPKDTVFIAAEHITSLDELKWIYLPNLSEEANESLKTLQKCLPDIRNKTSLERTAELPGINKNFDENEATKRATDWSEIRPEWGLAKNASFIIGKRTLTKNANLKARTFLHDYDWKKDKNVDILNNIISGPALVTQWINLQYYASTVIPHIYGSGNKITQSITSGLGVMQGNSSDLLIGLPWQSVMKSDCSMYHSPIRLTIVIQAPTEYIYKLFEVNTKFKQKIENEWLILINITENNEWIKW
ncbi:DUF2309 domain-containing protein [Staphylococcus massiliensis]|uniref:Probable inorganic carbon transporter subunit DabA n=1 Tax=Staphylococcus massiliensis S46 TaxID=1229783 RepID=K9ADI4_9STAP|nr:putative inorganic carbon transporter subunit DabA [Staphylococcus massiliensis]EKU45293.1 hypothetical protein C273_11456 [Staphylococcus massiliensis S46]